MPGREQPNKLLGAAILALLTTILFADVLFGGRGETISRGMDLFRYFGFWREFGFSEIRNGNFPLWNPHVFSGAPYHAGFQSALLYPPNLVFAIFSLSTALNVSVFFHTYLLGLFTYLWCCHRRHHPVGSLLAGAVMIFCGPYVTHILAGHITLFCAMAWAPLILMAVDKLWDRPSLKWFFIGCAAVTMQVLAAHPQTAFYGAVTVGVFSAFRIVSAKHRIKTVSLLAAMYILAGLMCAAQLLPTARATEMSVRSGDVSFEMVSSMSLPPENLTTAIVPGFLGGDESVRYWGQWYYWEVSAFVGVVVVLMAVCGVIYGGSRARQREVWICLILLILALGSHTPLLKLLYLSVPGFNKFRVSARFMFYLSLWISVLAAGGVSYFIRNKPTGKKVLIGLFAAAALLAVVGVCVRSSATGAGPGAWRSFFQAVASQSTSAYTRSLGDKAAFIKQAGLFASRGLFIAAALAAVVALLVWLRRYWKPAAYLIVILAAAELLVFARDNVGKFNLATTRPRDLEQFVQSNPGEYRILFPRPRNVGMSIGSKDIWGYDPFMIRRYAEFIAFTQGRDPNDVSESWELSGKDPHPWFSMLRCRYVFQPTRRGMVLVESPNPLPQALLVSDYQVIAKRDDIFAAMSSRDFDPRKTVILESEPNVKPAAATQPGRVKVVEQGTDHLVIEAELDSPAILLVTDAYSADWRVTPAEPGAQASYDLLPANYVLRGVPLAAGKHRLRMEYIPAGWVAGKWISLASVAIFFGGCGALCWLKRRRSAAPDSESA